MFGICCKCSTYYLILFSCPLESWVSLWNFETIRGSLMTPKWQRLASLAQEICTLRFQFFGAVFASKGYPFKNILVSFLVSQSSKLGREISFHFL